ncbi:AAA family ATPase (plasmid) [Novosphingobium sp. BL-8A]|uniref:AAA family ATPase n=1 Tax=Novosphingobium sp. BL-8A TaxID=3127639 RepID=UPI0037572C37
MSLFIRRIALENFRKFRQRHEIAGLTDGLNIVIENNEAGKSTLLEAVRAGLFLRHGSKTQLISSFQPLGDEVAPEVELDFAVGGDDYRLKKRFIGRAMAELSGPGGRSQNAEAEERLQRLLGFEAQGRTFDSELAGALGMLWVAQAEALSVTPPGGRVRDIIGATLQGEAGTILGGAAFQQVQGRIEAQFRQFFTEKGQVAKAGRLGTAQQRLAIAAETLAEAQQREQALETAFSELDQARRQLTTLRRDLDDDQYAVERTDLEKRLEAARGTAQLLAQRQLEVTGASTRLAGLQDLADRLAQTQDRLAGADARKSAAQTQRAALAETLASAQSEVTTAAAVLDAARRARDLARAALAKAQAQDAAWRRREGLLAAHARHGKVLALETERERLTAATTQTVPVQVLDELDAAEREILRHRALLETEGTHVELTGPVASLEGFTRDGHPLEPGAWTLTRETRVGLPGGGELVLRPPQALAGAQTALEAATRRRATLLAEWSLDSLTAARARNEAAREAQRQMETINARLLAATPADRDLSLAAGPDALKVLVAAHPLGPAATELDNTLSIAQAETECGVAETAFARAETLYVQASETLRAAEKADTPLAIAEQTAANDSTNAAEDLARLALHADFTGLETALAAAREGAASASVALENARANASAFDEEALHRRIETLIARRKAAEDARSDLNVRIAGLEARVESEGGKGLAEHAAAARDEHDSALASLSRAADEAEALRLLRETLAQAQAETARTITGPVAARAARYVGRILQDAQPAFAEDLGLASIHRGGLDEACEYLSRGTQEQLAMLTRLAFADMLLEEGRPVSLILDDPLVYSDDVRLDAMIDLITEASQRMQVILLTCRERAFRHVDGNRLRL